MIGTDAHLDELLHQMEERCIAHIDMDCFYCEVERRRDPSLCGKPMAVLQYNPRNPQELRPGDDRRVPDSDGSIIAVSYEARAQGVTRIMRGREARRQCPSIVLIQVPVRHNKSDISMYRDAGASVIAVLSRFATSVSRASIDEAYVDVTAPAAALMSRVLAGTEKLLPRGDPEPARGFGPWCHGWTWVAGVCGAGKSEMLTRADVRNGHSKLTRLAVEARETELVPAHGVVEAVPGTLASATDKGGHTHQPCPELKAPLLAAALPATPDASLVARATSSVLPSSPAPPTSPTGCREARGALHMQSLRDKAKRQQESAQAEKQRDEAAEVVEACRCWWQRPAQDWPRAELLLACGALVIQEMRDVVATELGYSCSAGLAHSMTLAKVGSAMHKPGMQTVLPSTAMAQALQAMPIERIRGLGGAVLGRQVREELGVETVGDLSRVPLSTLISKFASKSTSKPSRGSGVWLYRIARGIDLDEVKDEHRQRSYGAEKNFLKSKTGVLTDLDQVRFWLEQLASQVLEQLHAEEADNGQVATRLIVHWAGDDAAAVYAGGRSRRCRISRPYRQDRLVADALLLIKGEHDSSLRPLRVASLGLVATGLEALPTGNARITEMMGRARGRSEEEARDGVDAAPRCACDLLGSEAGKAGASKAAAHGGRTTATSLAPERVPVEAHCETRSAPEPWPPFPEAAAHSNPAPQYARISLAELDASVLAELPREVQCEVMAELGEAMGTHLHASCSPAGGGDTGCGAAGKWDASALALPPSKRQAAQSSLRNRAMPLRRAGNIRRRPGRMDGAQDGRVDATGGSDIHKYFGPRID